MRSCARCTAAAANASERRRRFVRGNARPKEVQQPRSSPAPRARDARDPTAEVQPQELARGMPLCARHSLGPPLTAAGRADTHWQRQRGYRCRSVGDVCTDDVTFAPYADRPSKLAPEGRCALNVEARLQAQAVPSDVRRDPMALLRLDDSRLAASLIRARRKKRLSAYDGVFAAMRLLASDSSRFTTNDSRLAKLGHAPETNCGRRISALARPGELVVLPRERGRCRRSRYHLVE